MGDKKSVVRDLVRKLRRGRGAEARSRKGGEGTHPRPEAEGEPEAPGQSEVTRIRELYRSRPFLDASSAHTDLRVERDPQKAVGGMWEELGRLQFDFMVGLGLRPGHRLLDIGCGTLRGGRHFIGYLEPEGYTGMDISAKAIDYGRRLVAEEGLGDKRPRLLVSPNKDLRFREFAGETFDYLLAQSVFTHVKPKHVEQCIAHVGAIMGPDSTFCFTFKEAPELTRYDHKNFYQPLSFYQSLADRYGFELEDRSAGYDHPRSQRMLLLRRPSS